MTKQQRTMLKLLADNEHLKLYQIPPSIRNYTARFSELRNQGWDIPAPKLALNREKKMMSTYSMPGDERIRAQRELREVLSE